MLFAKLNLDPGETVVLEVRRHWIVFLSRVIFFFAVAILPAIIFIFFIEFVPANFATFATSHFSIFLFFYSLWLLFLWMVIFIQWTNYYLDVWYITEKRIIDVNQKGIFYREVSNLRFDKIQDISIEINGVIATFLNFGDLKVQTAAEDSSDFFMKSARRPEEVRRIIFSHHNAEAEKLHRETGASVKVPIQKLGYSMEREPNHDIVDTSKRYRGGKSAL